MITWRQAVDHTALTFISSIVVLVVVAGYKGVMSIDERINTAFQSQKNDEELHQEQADYMQASIEAIQEELVILNSQDSELNERLALFEELTFLEEIEEEILEEIEEEIEEDAEEDQMGSFEEGIEEGDPGEPDDVEGLLEGSWSELEDELNATDEAEGVERSEEVFQLTDQPIQSRGSKKIKNSFRIPADDYIQQKLEQQNAEWSNMPRTIKK
jgi:hypothetical protein